MMTMESNSSSSSSNSNSNSNSNRNSNSYSNTDTTSKNKKNYTLTRCCIAVLAIFQIIVFFDAYRNNPYTATTTTTTMTTMNKGGGAGSGGSLSNLSSRSTEEESSLLHVYNNDHSNFESDGINSNDSSEDDNNDNDNDSQDNSQDDNKDGEDEVNDSKDNSNDNGSEDNDEGSSNVNDNSNSSSNDQEDEDEDENEDDDAKRTTYWMDYRSIVKDKADYYSGSWYMPIKKFKNNLNAKNMNTLEDASGTAVFHDNRKDVRMPYDWFDFSVEHMSKWYKDLDITSPDPNDVAINILNNNLLRYIQDTPKKMIKATTTTVAMSIATNTNTTVTRRTRTRTRNRRMKEQTNNTTTAVSLLHPTIAIIPFAPDIRYDTPLSISRSKNLTTLMLGATISSLIRLGFGRIVIVGIEDDDDILVKDCVNLIKKQFTENKNMQLGYVQVTDQKTYQTAVMNVNRPKAAIRGLQLALTGKLNNTADIDRWLGTRYGHNYWKYIYFTEPDLVLQTRINGVTSTIPSLYEELNSGHSLMPFRLQPIPHESDLVGTTRQSHNYLSSNGKFRTVVELNGNPDDDDDDESGNGGDMCCDGGTDRPVWDNKDDPVVECYSFWYGCGFLNEVKNYDEEIKHRRIVDFAPLMRITSGTNIVTIPGSEHARKCHPVKRRKRKGTDEIGDSIDFCQPPSSPSKRSYAVSEKKKKKKI